MKPVASQRTSDAAFPRGIARSAAHHALARPSRTAGSRGIRLILASTSPQRRRLLKTLGMPFRIVPPKVSENSSQRDIRRLVRELALKKARWVARSIGRRAGGPSAGCRSARHAAPAALDRIWVLGADTLVACLGKILAKPRNRRDSLRMLSILNGRWHRVYTGVALVHAASRRALRDVTLSRVKARRLSAAALESLAGKHLDNSGSYALQDRRDPFIEKVVGPVDNVIGLPMGCVRRLIRRAGELRIRDRK
ncbi:MAG: Maf-like protein [Elusimicrobia bacterium]|nr:Maf-like protein [Elusimicrobiota bacterium]